MSVRLTWSADPTTDDTFEESLRVALDVYRRVQDHAS